MLDKLKVIIITHLKTNINNYYRQLLKLDSRALLKSISGFLKFSNYILPLGNNTPEVAPYRFFRRDHHIGKYFWQLTGTWANPDLLRERINCEWSWDEWWKGLKVMNTIGSKERFRDKTCLRFIQRTIRMEFNNVYLAIAKKLECLVDELSPRYIEILMPTSPHL